MQRGRRRQRQRQKTIDFIERFHMTSRRPYWRPKTMQKAAMLGSQTNPLGVELFSYANAFFCSNKFA